MKVLVLFSSSVENRQVLTSLPTLFFNALNVESFQTESACENDFSLHGPRREERTNDLDIVRDKRWILKKKK